MRLERRKHYDPNASIRATVVSLEDVARRLRAASADPNFAPSAEAIEADRLRRAGARDRMVNRFASRIAQAQVENRPALYVDARISGLDATALAAAIAMRDEGSTTPVAELYARAAND